MRWPPSARSNPGSRCWPPGARTSAWSMTPHTRARGLLGAAARRSGLAGPAGAAGQRDHRALRASGASTGERLRRADGDHHRHRVGQVAVLPAPDARGAGHRPQGPRAVPVPDQGAGPGPGALDRPLRPDPSRAPGDLRRRHAAQRALGDPQALEPDPHQPRHAPRRDPAPPPGVGRPVLKPRLRRRRRGPRLPRGVRLPRRQRAAAAAPRGGDPRHDAALPAHLSDDRQPGGAGRAPHRP